MDGKELTQQIELRLIELGMKKKDFYKLAEISSASFSQWNTGRSQPSRDALHRIDAVLGTSFELSNKSDNMYDTIQMLQGLRTCDRILLEAARAVDDEDTIMGVAKLLLKFKRNDADVD